MAVLSIHIVRQSNRKCSGVNVAIENSLLFSLETSSIYMCVQERKATINNKEQQFAFKIQNKQRTTYWTVHPPLEALAFLPLIASNSTSKIKALLGGIGSGESLP